MRVGLYNQMFGLDGRSFWSTLVGHWAIHLQRNKKRIWKRTNIDWTIETIKKSKADVVGICEIIEGQEKELRKGLGELGYKYIHFAPGHKTSFSKLYMKIALASKIKFEVKNNNSAAEKEMSRGGGFIHCWFPELKADLIIIHLSLNTKNVHHKHLHLLENYLKGLEKKVILLGDFNFCWPKIKSYFKDLKLVSGRTKTCSMTPVMKWFVYKDFDHILVRGSKKKASGEIIGYSDHKLIWVDLIEHG